MRAKRKVEDPLEPERHQCARVEMFSNHSRDRGSTMNVTTYGLDLAKRVFQAHWVEPDTGELKRKALTRTEVAAFFARRAHGIVAMESCGSAHYWGRVLSGLGHQVRLIAPQFTRPFVKTNKTDAADAEAIWEASQRRGDAVCGAQERGATGGIVAASNSGAIDRVSDDASEPGSRSGVRVRGGRTEGLASTLGSGRTGAG